jgi:tetratricopeptide (TPR) repeat protein
MPSRVYNLCGDLDAEERLAKETNKISRRNHFAYYEAQSECHLAWVAGARGLLAEGIQRMVGGIAALGEAATSLALPGFYVLLAQLYIRAGQWDEARKVLQMAVGARDHAVWDADVERVRGDLLSLQVDPDLWAAETAYRASLTIARRQRAGLLEFKAGLNLARLLRDLDRPKEGFEILSVCLEKLHGEFGTADARNARILMNDLAVTDH